MIMIWLLLVKSAMKRTEHESKEVWVPLRPDPRTGGMSHGADEGRCAKHRRLGLERPAGWSR